MSSLVFRMAAKPSRTTRWSSAIRTLIFSIPSLLLVTQRYLDDDFRTFPRFGLDVPFAAHQASSFQDTLDAEMIPLFRVTQNGFQIEADSIVGNNHAQQIHIDVQLDGDSVGFGMLLDVAQGFLNDSKKKDLRPWKENLFIPRYRKFRGNVGLGLVRLETIRQGGNQFHLIVMQRAQVENHLPGFLDGQFQLRLGLLDGGQTGS